MAPTIQMDLVTDALELTEDERKQIVTKVSLQAGVKAFATTAVVSGLGVAAALRYSPWFNRVTGTSGRVACVMLPSCFAFTLLTEQVASRLANPLAFDTAIRSQQASTLSIPKRMANYVYDKPFQTLIFTSVPTVAGIFMMKSRESNLIFSQKIMHTRVLGQASVLSLLIGTMLFYDFMDRRGRFTDDLEVMRQ